MLYPREHRLEYLKSATGIEDFSDMDLLDWGGNRGNLIRDGINIKSYTCVDIDAQAIEFGKHDFPQHTWIHYNKFHPVYNVQGSNLLTDVSDNSFDLIFAYSVFTHDTLSEMLNELDMLKDKLRDQGVLCASFIDLVTAKLFVLKRESEYRNTIDRDTFDNLSDYVYFVDNLTVTKEYDRTQKCKHFLNVCNTEWLLEILKSVLGECEIYSPDLSNIGDFDTTPFQPSFIWRKS